MGKIDRDGEPVDDDWIYWIILLLRIDYKINLICVDIILQHIMKFIN